MTQNIHRDLLKIVTCGSVDDGKSTLIGRMLYDSKMLYADQVKALELDSKVSLENGEIDYSLLLDSLEAEREQKITIDVAYRYFSTNNRNFIIADCPGHEEYTRNMAVGASFADLAIILIDASKGVLPQTRRHTRICSMMGIEHFVFAVNKMDLINYSKPQFEKISDKIKRLVSECGSYKTLQIIPISATNGVNITEQSNDIGWYSNGSLFEYLETIDLRNEQDDEEFIMPVQRVCRPNSEFRGFQGSVVSGALSIGDNVIVYPSKNKSSVSDIITNNESVMIAQKGQPVTIRLNDEIDVSRGCILSNEQIDMSQLFLVDLLWTDENDLVEGKSFYIEIGTNTLTGTILKIKHKIDVNSGEEVAASRIRKNDLARCEISLSSKIAYKPFNENHELGSMILVDRITNATSACAVILHKLNRSDNLTWHNMHISRELREIQNNQKAITIWFTGLSGSGKSTIANAVEQRLYQLGCRTMLLDGDNIRLGINKNLGFTEEDRVENIRRISEVSKLMNGAGLIVLTSFISPFIRDRKSARETIGEDNFIEIYVSTPLEECEKRDVKGLYAKARRHEIDNFTGVTSPYEIPTDPDLEVDTSNEALEDSVERILSLITERISLT